MLTFSSSLGWGSEKYISKAHKAKPCTNNIESIISVIPSSFIFASTFACIFSIFWLKTLKLAFEILYKLFLYLHNFSSYIGEENSKERE